MDEPSLVLIDKWARRYGRRPSEILYGDGIDLAFDLLCMEAGLDAGDRLAKQAGEKGVFRVTREA